MNPDDPNQGGGQPGDQGSPATGTPTTPAEPAANIGGGADIAQGAPAPSDTAAGGQPAPSEPTAAETCHCGRSIAAGNCSGCNLPTASCTCAPSA